MASESGAPLGHDIVAIGASAGGVAAVTDLVAALPADFPAAVFVSLHLMLRPGYLQVVRGPKENGHRPAVDALFRSAAIAYGPRVIGVILTGYQDDGTGGLLSIKARGGVTVVQDPADAVAPDMPRSALAHVEVDHVAPVSQVPALLLDLVRRPAGRPARHLTGSLAELEGDEPGLAAEIVCPVLGGDGSRSAIRARD